MSGQINKYFNIGVKQCGSNICGVYSAQYSLSQQAQSVFPLGQTIAAVQYTELPNIEMSYSQYIDSAGSYNGSEFNASTKIELANRGGSVICDMGLLSKISYNFNIDGPFLVTKTYTGFHKPTSGGPASTCSGKPAIRRRQDYTGSLPPGLSISGLSSVIAEVSVNRQFVGEFSTRKPYASYVVFPVTSTVTFEGYTDGADSFDINAFAAGCTQTTPTKYSLNVSACGSSISINNAIMTELSYDGADATVGSSPQKVRVTFTSQDTPAGIKPVIIFPESESSC